MDNSTQVNSTYFWTSEGSKNWIFIGMHFLILDKFFENIHTSWLQKVIISLMNASLLIFVGELVRAHSVLQRHDHISVRFNKYRCMPD